jgi:quaternary ammonium compound-resistance protein SugE
MPWLYLLLAGACEMVWPLGFKYTHGFSRNHWATGCTFGVMILSFWLMSLATKQGVHIGTAYAVWTGLGAAGTAILGMILFNEPRDFLRIGLLSLIIIGAVGLKFVSPPEQKFDDEPAPPAFPVATQEGETK